MSLSAGTRLGPYEILAPIGAGGMGEVYRAHDTKLRRDIAIKVLPEAFSRDADRMARFEREARTLAALNHPNIAAIYGLQEGGPPEAGSLRALVMELVEGPTLAEKIQAGPLALEETLDLARQIAEALEYAHDRGVVHRDLKPPNVKITPQGALKVLDFGLAKALEEGAQAEAHAADSPTLTINATRAGVILGTVAYMSPEQAKGKPADRRSDIWAFGVVLFEMLTGSQLYSGETAAETMASVMKEAPALDRLPAGTPANIRRLIGRCLEKDPRRRLQAIGEARIAIEEVLSGSPQIAEPQAEGPRYSSPRLWPWIAAVAALALAAPAAWFLKPKPEQPMLQVEISPPEGISLGPVADAQFTLSPDGRRLVFFAAGKDGKRMLWMRLMDTGTTTAVAGSENAAGQPFWSPDSRWVAFAAGGKLQKLSVAGGQPQVICDTAGAAYNSLGTWNSDDVILFTEVGKPLQRVSATGGTPAPVFPLDAAGEETGHRDPFFLPDGQHFFYHSSAKQTGIMLGSLDGKTRRFLFPNLYSAATYAVNPAGGGWMLYSLQGGQLFARPFDPRKLEFTGEATPIGSSLVSGPSWSASSTGLLVYRRSLDTPTQLGWFSRDGKALGAAVESGLVSSPRISPDQTTIAFVRADGNSADIWLFDMGRNNARRFTFEPGYDFAPIWSPDGRAVVYSSTRQNEQTLVERPANGIGAESILARQPASGFVIPTGISPDGRWLLSLEDAGNARTMLRSRPQGGQPVVLLQGQDQTEASLSPDGRWLVYEANSAGRREVFVQPFSAKDAAGSANAAGKFQISAGGSQPVWRGDGKEIYYVALDGKMMAAPVESGEDFFRSGTPKPLFQTRLPIDPEPRQYDVSRDGQRFLLNQAAAGAPDPPITAVVNWPRLLQK